jgi:hypothetical protein
MVIEIRNATDTVDLPEIKDARRIYVVNYSTGSGVVRCAGSGDTIGNTAATQVSEEALPSGEGRIYIGNATRDQYRKF